MRERLKLLFILLLLFPIICMAQTADFTYTGACVHDTMYFYNTSVSEDSIIAAGWDFDMDGQFDDSQGDTVYNIFGAAGQQNVGLRIVTETGKAKSIYKALHLGFRPKAAFSYENTCTGEITSFFNESTTEAGEIDNFIWYFGNGQVDSTHYNPTYLYDDVNQYTVSLKVSTSEACKDSISKNILIANKPEKPAIVFSGDTTFPSGDSLQMTVVGTFDSIYWSTGDTTESIVVRNSGIYKLTVANGTCTHSRTVRVSVINAPEINRNKIQNVITPNADGFNDKWVIPSIDEYRPCAVNVINKRGNTVFSTSNYNNDWAGTHNGNPLPEGTYYYVIKCIRGESFKGAINIIR